MGTNLSYGVQMDRSTVISENKVGKDTTDQYNRGVFYMYATVASVE